MRNSPRVHVGGAPLAAGATISRAALLRSSQLRHCLDRGQQLTQSCLVLRVLANQLLQIDGLSRLQLVDDHFQHVAQHRIFAGVRCAG